MPKLESNLLSGTTARVGVARVGATRLGDLHRETELNPLVPGDYLWTQVAGTFLLDTDFAETDWTVTET